jgi:hypothetical protein
MVLFAGGLMKRLVCILFLFTLLSLLCGDQNRGFSVSEHLILDELIDQSVNLLFDSFQSVPPDKFHYKKDSTIEGFGMLFESAPQDSVLEDKIFSRMKKAFTKTKFRLYEKENIDNILQEQDIQSNDFYSQKGRLNAGNLTPWKGFLIGKVSPTIEKNLGKKKLYLDFSCDFCNLETGELIWSESVRNYQRIRFPMHFFLIAVALIVLGIAGFNIITQGKKTSFILGSGILAMLLLFIWFFFI